MYWRPYNKSNWPGITKKASLLSAHSHCMILWTVFRSKNNFLYMKVKGTIDNWTTLPQSIKCNYCLWVPTMTHIVFTSARAPFFPASYLLSSLQSGVTTICWEQRIVQRWIQIGLVFGTLSKATLICNSIAHRNINFGVQFPLRVRRLVQCKD